MNDSPEYTPLDIPEGVSAAEFAAAVVNQLEGYRELSASVRADIVTGVRGCADQLRGDLRGAQSCITAILAGRLSSAKISLGVVREVISHAVSALSGQLLEQGLGLNADLETPLFPIPPTTSRPLPTTVAYQTTYDDTAVATPLAPSQPATSPPSAPEPGQTAGRQAIGSTSDGSSGVVSGLPPEKTGPRYDVYFNDSNCTCREQPAGSIPPDPPWYQIAAGVIYSEINAICAGAIDACVLAAAPSGGGGIVPPVPPEDGAGGGIGGVRGRLPGGHDIPYYWALCPGGGDRTGPLNGWTDQGSLDSLIGKYALDPLELAATPDLTCDNPYSWIATNSMSLVGPFCSLKDAQAYVDAYCAPGDGGKGPPLPPAPPEPPSPPIDLSKCCPCPPPDWITWLFNPCDVAGHKAYKAWAGSSLSDVLNSSSMEELERGLAKEIESSLSQLRQSRLSGPLEAFSSPGYTVT